MEITGGMDYLLSLKISVDFSIRASYITAEINPNNPPQVNLLTRPFSLKAEVMKWDIEKLPK